jgi:hypothetical protein
MPSHNFNELTDAIHSIYCPFTVCFYLSWFELCCRGFHVCGVRPPYRNPSLFISSVERDEIIKP